MHVIRGGMFVVNCTLSFYRTAVFYSHSFTVDHDIRFDFMLDLTF
jgi:hypothetical protein